MAASQITLKGKVALVTGGNRGIGLAIAQSLAREGCKVVVTGRDAKALKAASSLLGKDSFAVRCDVCDPRAVAKLFREIGKRCKSLDILVNNAGVAHGLANIDALSLEEWSKVIDTNLTGLFLVTRQALPMMRRGGSIVNTLSIAAYEPFAGMAAYNAAKFGALGFTEALREELREKGIRVTALVPGATATDIWEQFWPDAPKSKMVQPESIAEALVALLKLPAEASPDTLRITPVGGKL